MSLARGTLPAPPSRAADLDDDFSSGIPDPRLWVTSYLPHWTVPDRAAARWNAESDGIRLRIDEDQLDWRPEDAPLRVSNLQTAQFSGPQGSAQGMHRHRTDLAVRTESPMSLLFVPEQGRVDITISATRGSGCVVAAWLVGTEHLSPEDSGEICLFEIDAGAVTDVATRARSGLKAHHDPRLTTDMTEVSLPFDAGRPHTWTAVWASGETIIACEGVVVRRLAQAPDYPLALMIDIFEVDTPGGSYPKSFMVHRVRGWSG